MRDDTLNDFVTRFDREFAPKLGMRASTFRAVLQEAITHAGIGAIVETGCMRQADNWAGDGQSTIIWNEYRKWKGEGNFDSVDLDKEAVALAKTACELDVWSDIHEGDSVLYLSTYKNMIDVLYLDSFDLDMNAPHDAAMHCLFELTAAMPNLRRNSIVFVDDSPMGHDFRIRGKAMYVAEFMAKLGIRPFTLGYQVAWLWPLEKI